jgi:NAD(P)-dependent dehydrogenase (short-subunit alcohol dehydrogenase family)
VNNAGIGTIGEMEWMNIDTVKKVFDVNTFGPVRVTTAFLPLLRISRGRVVIVSSMTGMSVQSYKVTEYQYLHINRLMVAIILTY